MNRFRCLSLVNSNGFADQRCLVEDVTNSIRLPQIQLQHDNVQCQVQIKQHPHRPPTLNFISAPSGQRLYLSLQESVVKISRNATAILDQAATASTIASVFRVPVNNDVEYIPHQEGNRFDFECLPCEMQVHIFSYLNCFDLINAAQVCKWWNEISKYIRTGKRSLIMEQNSNTVIDDQFLNRWLSNFTNLRCFKHNKNCDLGKSVFEILGSKCPHLEILELSTVHLTDRGLWVIANGCRKLKRARFECPKLTEFGIRWLFTLCKGLEHFEIIGMPCLKGLYLHDSFPKLKTLVLEKCPQMHEFTDIFQSFPNLTSLTLKSLPNLADEHLQHIYENCRNIEKLEISNVPAVSRFGLSGIAGLRNLKSLSIENTTTFGMDCVLKDISKNCFYLDNLNISRCEYVTDIGMQSLSALPNLQTLSINRLNRITSKSLKAISSCKNLKFLSVEECSNVDNSGLLDVVSKCPYLEVLKVSNILKINTDFIVSCCKCFNEEKHAKTLIIEVSGCSVSTKELMAQYHSTRLDEFQFFAKCHKDGRWDAARWLWGFSEMNPDNGGIEEYEYWCQQY